MRTTAKYGAAQETCGYQGSVGIMTESCVVELPFPNGEAGVAITLLKKKALPEPIDNEKWFKSSTHVSSVTSRK